MRSSPSAYRNSPIKVLRLWVHECKRVFEDRFINIDDIKVFRDYIKDTMLKTFGEQDEKDKDFPLEEPSIFTSFVSIH